MQILPFVFAALVLGLLVGYESGRALSRNKHIGMIRRRSNDWYEVADSVAFANGLAAINGSKK